MSKQRKAGRPRKDAKFSDKLLNAAKDAGFTDEQVAAVKDEESLRNLVIKVRPQAMPNDVPFEKPPEPKTLVREPEMVSRDKGFTIELSPQVALTWKRGDYEQSEQDRFVSRNGIKNRVRVEITQRYVPNENSKYETEFKIYYKEPKQ